MAYACRKFGVDRMEVEIGSDTPQQFGRFLVVGVSNTALSFVVYRLLLIPGTPYVVAAPVAFAVGALNGYIFNRRWTFVARDTARARVLYVAVAAGGAGLTSLLVYLFAHVAETGRVFAYVAAIPPVTVSTFVANRRWTFREPQAQRTGTTAPERATARASAGDGS
jgi:putative flippase GtrA